MGGGWRRGRVASINSDPEWLRLHKKMAVPGWTNQAPEIGAHLREISTSVARVGIHLARVNAHAGQRCDPPPRVSGRAN